jgi:hypothetical protein
MWKRRLCGLIVPALLLAGATLTHAFPWSMDMKIQPSIKPQEAPRRPVPGTVPREGWEPSMTREDAGKLLKNPHAITPQSLENGRRLFDIYCSHCHGPNGKGMGIVSTKFIPAPDLTLQMFKDRTDGFIYGQIRSGGPLMPPHGEVLSPTERWDVVNYVRKLQGLPLK